MTSLRSWLVPLILLGVIGYALAEDLTLTTYYPSPRGVYKELRTSGDVAIGTTSPPRVRLEVQGSAGPADVALLITNQASGLTPTLSRLAVTNDGQVGLGMRPLSAASPQALIIGTSAGLTGADCGSLPWQDEDGDSAYDPGECKQAHMVVTQAGQVGIGTTSPAAALDVRSTNSGFLPPRLTPSAVSSPVEGMVIYNTDSNQLEVYDGTDWKAAGGETSHGIWVRDAPGNYTFPVPSGVNMVTVEIWAPGGGGGGPVGGGGGGGAFCKDVVPVVSGALYTAVVGAGGGGLEGEGTERGGDSSTSRFSGPALTVLALGGAGGNSAGAPSSAGGGPGGSTHVMCRSTITGTNGSAASESSGGAGGSGGNGGAGGTPGCPGAPGVAPGGGGGGNDDACASRAGSGAPGRVIVSW